jgi:dTMP kinase
VRKLYGFARIPDYTLYFRLPLETALGRILEGRPQLKYFEAGMDIGLSSDIYESFWLFQGRVMEQYEGLAGEFGFTILDATRNVHDQQQIVRSIIGDGVDLSHYRTRVPR